MSGQHRRAVISGFGIISPLGLDGESLWDALINRKSGIKMLDRVPSEHLTTNVCGAATGFTADIEQFGPLEKLQKRAIKKGLKLMCREIQMGVAAAQLALHHSGVELANIDSKRFGTMFGSDYIVTEPQEYESAIAASLNENGEFDFAKWWADGDRPKVEPLWLLKYLPNMPASHVAIYNDLQGPSNSVTMRESSSNIAIGEARTTIQRNLSDCLLAGATGSRLQPLRAVNTALQEELAMANGDPAGACRPFDEQRSGMVIGEGAAIMLIEELEHARNRNAEIYGEVVSCATSTVADVHGVVDPYQAFKNVIEMALRQSDMQPADIGHVHAHGMSSRKFDQGEAQAIYEVFGDQTPVVAAKSNMGNLGAGSGAVEIVASLLAMQQGQLFPVLNCDQPCQPISISRGDAEPGSSFMNLNITPQGQASALVIRQLD